ncbi:MAG TPA: hypothetical protein VGI70_18235 [Polyangiales bacterium]|jgi:hypothetical protein
MFLIDPEESEVHVIGDMIVALEKRLGSTCFVILPPAPDDNRLLASGVIEPCANGRVEVLLRSPVIDLLPHELRIVVGVMLCRWHAMQARLRAAAGSDS